MGLKEKLPEGFHRIGWEETTIGQNIWLLGIRDQQPAAYGPHKVHDKYARRLENRLGQRFIHYAEDLLTKNK